MLACEVKCVGHPATTRGRTCCPSYTQYLAIVAGNAPTAAVQQRFYLNCAAARHIPAHGSVTFAMRIAVPAGSGWAKYDWQLQDTEVATAGMVRIREP